jgi:hypothetical protein
MWPRTPKSVGSMMKGEKLIAALSWTGGRLGGGGGATAA